MRRMVSRTGSGCHVARVVAALAVTLGCAAIAYGQDRSASLARYFPREDLVVYAEFEGIDAHSNAWNATAAAKILYETKTGAMLESLAAQVAEMALASVESEGRLTGADFLSIVKQTFRSGFAFGIVRKPGQPRPSCVALVFRGAARGPVRGALDRLLKPDNADTLKTIAKAGGRIVTVAGQNQGLSWWVEQNDLVFSLASAEGIDLIIDVLEGKQPSAADHPVRVELARVDDGFEPVGLAYFELAAIPALPPQAAALGLDRIVRIDYRWGFQDDAIMTVTRLVVPAPRRGALALLEQPTFQGKSFPPLPADLNEFVIFSFDPHRFYAQIAAIIQATDPGGRGSVEDFERAVHDATQLRLREDILAHLGPRMAYYVVPTKVNAPTDPFSGFVSGLVHVPKATLLVEIDDPVVVRKVVDSLVTLANQSLKAQAGARKAPSAELVPLEGQEGGYALVVPPAAGPFPAGLTATAIVGKKFLVIGTTPAAARRALALEGQAGAWKPANALLAKAIERLPRGLTFLAVSDTRESLLPEAIANLPGLVQLVGSGGTPGAMLSNLLPFPPFLLQESSRSEHAFQLKMDPNQIPSAEDVKPFLFPGVFAFTVDDQGFRFITRESFPALNPVALAPVALAAALPAVQAARTSAKRVQSTNNLKQIGLAMHNYHDVNGQMPPGSISDKDGKPLLSWRVALLPYLEQQVLYNEFKLDEPWDSPNNKALLERMPATYVVPGSKAEPGMTFYRGFSGRSAIFDPAVKKGVSLAQITDGTSNTIAVVEAKVPVPWTQPDSDIPFDIDIKPEDLDKLKQLLGSHFPGGFNALFLDGSVRFIRETINLIILRALITRDGGEVVSTDSF